MKYVPYRMIHTIPMRKKSPLLHPVLEERGIPRMCRAFTEEILCVDSALPVVRFMEGPPTSATPSNVYFTAVFSLQFGLIWDVGCVVYYGSVASFVLYLAYFDL